MTEAPLHNGGSLGSGWSQDKLVPAEDLPIGAALEAITERTREAKLAIEARDVAIAEAYGAGASLADLATASGLSVETTRQTLKRRDVQLRPRGQHHKRRREVA